MSDILKQLAEPFPPERISWRVGPTTQDKSRGQALAYLNARDVMQRLDDVVRPENWQRRYSHAGDKCVCEIGIKLDGEWVWKADGAGDTDVEKEKGALSDAFKRSAVNWGIGRYLYDLPAPWVALQQKGRSYVIADHEMPRLQALLMRKSNEPVGNDNEQPKSAYQARKDGDWQKLKLDLDRCNTAEDVSHFLRVNAPTINRMPDNWRGRWDELVAAKLDDVRARAAA